MRDCFNYSAIPTFFLSHDGSLVYANRAFGELLGYEMAQCAGLAIAAIVHPDDADQAQARATSVAHGEREGSHSETRYLRSNGAVTWVRESVSRLRGRRGQPPYLIIQAVNIDRQKQLETKVEMIDNRWNFSPDSVGHGFWDYDRERNRAICSPAWKRMRGFDPGDDVGDNMESWIDRVHPEDRTRVLRELLEFDSGQHNTNQTEYRELHKDGHWLRIVTRRKIIEWANNGAARRLIGVDTDITDLKNAEEKLQFANTVLTTQMDASPDGILVVNAQARIISCNQRFAKMWNIPVDLLKAKEDAPVLMAVTSAMKNPEEFMARVQYLYEHPEVGGHDELETKDGRWIDRHTEALRTPAGGYLGRVWFFRDVTERKRTEAQILRMARFDALTGLANRMVFMEAVERAAAGVKRGATRGGRTFAVLYLDLNHFKDVNDTLGHAIGDELLKAVAGRLRSATRESDIVARFGGDEFAVIVTDISEPDDAAVVAKALLSAIQAPFSLQGYDIRTGVSIGIAVFGPDEPGAETMLARADIALYRAKSEERDGFRFHTDTMDNEIRTRVMLSSELREGIERGQLFLVYQPQVEIATHRIVGVEALVRWRHPAHGVLEPNIFLAIAEKTGLVAALGHWVLREACNQTREWLDAGIAPAVVGVNLSGVQFKRAFELEAEIAAVLGETGMPANRLELELTETVLMAASIDHSDVLNRLRQSGIKLAIDDFGVGYSSLDYLRRFPVDRIKIAGDFVAQITTEAGSAAIVKATLGLARELGIRVIAEGVTTAAQLELLRSWDCREAQGFYFAQPLTVEAVTPLLKSGFVWPEQRLAASEPALPVGLAE